MNGHPRASHKLADVYLAVSSFEKLYDFRVIVQVYAFLTTMLGVCVALFGLLYPGGLVLTTIVVVHFSHCKQNTAQHLP